LATPRSLAWPIEARTAREPELAAVAIIDFYSHVLPGMQEDAAAKVDAAIRGAIEKNSRWGAKAAAHYYFAILLSLKYM
jgi:hypothetical protein